MHRIAFRSAVAAAALALLGPAGPAYLVLRTRTGAEIRWNLGTPAPNVLGGRVTYFVDTSGVPDVTGNEFADAVRTAVQSWEEVPASSIAFLEETGRRASHKDASDRINRFGFSPGVLSPFAFASAFTATIGSRIVDVDVVFNPEMSWAVQTPGDPAKADVRGVATHEWGHGLGLDHVPLARSTMFYAASPGQLSLRTLETDDRAGVSAAYPAPSLATDFASMAGHVDVAGTADERGIQVIAIDYSTGLPAASSLTDPDGNYEIQGLPPAVYRVVAAPIGSDRIANHVYSRWWDSAPTSVLPAVLGIGGAKDGTTGALVLAAGQAATGIDLSVAAIPDPNEPNESILDATPFALGRSAAGRIDNQNDHDVYSFQGTAGHTVSVFVHARQIGSDLDPRLYLRDSSGVALKISDDIATDLTTEAGADTDSRILDFPLPSTGTYFLEVEATQSPDETRPEDFFYVLTLLEGGTGSPNPATSTLTANPGTVPADGASSASLTFVPRTLQATLLGPGRSVSFEIVPDGDPDGTLSGVVDHGDGTYTATLTAPPAAGADTVRALVDGVPVSTATVRWRGPADFDASGFSARPRRIRHDGSSTSTLTLVPRDALGVPFGAGHAVQISLSGSPASLLGATVDGGDGSYAAGLTAGTVEEDPDVTAVVDGGDPLAPYAAGVGFPLVPVIVQDAADLAAILASDPPPPMKAAPRLDRARALLLDAGSLDPATRSVDILKGVLAALRQIEAAGRKGGDASDLARELAEAAREAARDALDAAAPAADTPAEQAALASGEAGFVRGDSLLDGGSRSRAAARYLAALRSARKVH